MRSSIVLIVATVALGLAGCNTANRESEQPPVDQAQSDAPVATIGTSASQQTSAESQQSSADTDRASASDLPKTASPLSLIGFVGLLSLGGAIGVRRARGHRLLPSQREK